MSQTISDRLKRFRSSEFFRFLLVGISNTFVGYFAFLLLLPFLPYLYAYSLAYCIGIINSYFMNVLFVFKKNISLRSFLKFPIVYAIQYLLGAFILWLLVDNMRWPAAGAMAVAIVATIPATFLTSRFILKR